jgi:SAM-dependent methyltransferase
MKFTVFTPVHKPNERFIGDLYRSLCEQTYEGVIEWFVVLNGQIKDSEWDEIITKLMSETETKANVDVVWTRHDTDGNVSALKRFACDKATGDVLVEVDWDDILREDAIASLASAFEHEEVMFAYSNSAQFGDETWQAVWEGQYPYGAYWGWKFRPTTYKGHDLIEMIAFPPTAHSIKRIEQAPNHVRAWRASAYKQIGGHNPEITLGDDHDIVCRTYLAFGEYAMKHIDECLYFYCKHETNTCFVRNKEVQDQVHLNYLKYINQLATRWANDHNLRKLDLGGRFNAWEGYETVDLLDADIVMNLNEDWSNIADDSVGVIKAHHIIEHLKNPIHFFNEAYRVLAPGGFLLVEVPSTNGVGAWCDPTHVSYFNEHSFQYYTNEQYARFIRPSYTGRFQAASIREWWWNKPKLPVVTAELICVKPEYEQYRCGELLI